MEALTTPEILREQAHLNLLQRCVLIERQLRVVISTSTLRNAYKQMGVGFLKVHRGWYAAHSEMELRRQRVLFCRKMEAHLAEGREIIYIDETSTNCWMARGKIWQPRNSVLPLNFHPGDQMLDEAIDLPPYAKPHVKLEVARFVTTSCGSVVRKAGG